ncbi:type IV secretion system protein VirB5 [Bartonella sp. F02]|uniref:type IV secretion system protein VirB5 n=1 Tax=Bartonella sp. F02 TaxID=2967262 RepID=UPI0022A9B132|nr:type IV secretion system protein VirB5 [Bartonella sp. F02]MCZ2328936.1 type IV secretion system protein VirB5 [Bartonella sp. F02]
MKKYYLAAFLPLFFISNAMSQDISNVDAYYQTALKSTQTLNDINPEDIYKLVEQKKQEISDLEQQFINVSASTSETKTEELQQLQIKISLLQAELQMGALGLQSLSMIKAKTEKTKEEIREEEQQKKHKQIEEKLNQKLAQSKGKLNLR